MADKHCVVDHVTKRKVKEGMTVKAAFDLQDKMRKDGRQCSVWNERTMRMVINRPQPKKFVDYFGGAK